ncbi:hypothetical protein WKT22_04852 [Candidatus Lokiarchaeum ossiferum]
MDDDITSGYPLSYLHSLSDVFFLFLFFTKLPLPTQNLIYIKISKNLFFNDFNINGFKLVAPKYQHDMKE